MAPKWLPGAWTSDGMTVQIKSNVIGINRDAGNATRKVATYVAGAGRINRSATADIEIRRRGNQPVLQGGRLAGQITPALLVLLSELLVAPRYTTGERCCASYLSG